MSESGGCSEPGVRVVVVDDDPGIRHLVGRVLGRKGWEVVGEAADGRGAADLVGRLQPDVVVLDLMMPTPGDEVLPSLLRLAPRCMVAVFSGADPGENRDRLLRLGAFSYYTKADWGSFPEDLARDLERFRDALDGHDTTPPWLGRRQSRGGHG